MPPENDDAEPTVTIAEFKARERRWNRGFLFDAFSIATMIAILYLFGETCAILMTVILRTSKVMRWD